MKVNGIDALFEMPARVEPVYVLLCKRKGSSTGRYSSNGQIIYPDLFAKAERVAWRQLLRWVQAQNAMIDTGMVQPMEIFTAYWIPPGTEHTLFQQISQGAQLKMLPAPEKPQ